MTMSSNTEQAQKRYTVTKADINQINRRSIFGFQLGWNYERMQGSGYLFAMLPVMRKIYGDHTPELKQMMRTENQFFNTSNFLNNLVIGIDLAVQENEGAEGEETVIGLKTGLMGPFASVGDTPSSVPSYPRSSARSLRAWPSRETLWA